MTTLFYPPKQDEIVYPESDGKPISDHTLQFRFITTIQGNLATLFAEDPDVFVAGDLLWYPVEGNPKLRTAPDVLVVFGRPKGERGSYQQWKEGGIPPQVVFEIKSPGNRTGEMYAKLLFYAKYSVEEFYSYDPFTHEFTALIRSADGTDFVTVDFGGSYVSPRLGIRFEQTEGEELRMYKPDGQRFLTFVEIEQARQALRVERDTLAQERDVLESERDDAEERAARLAQRLRELGIDPESV